MAPQTSIKLTYEDYATIPDDGRRHEIIDGEHYVNPAPNIKHQTVSMRLAAALYNFVTANSLGQVFHPRIDVVLSEYDVVEPDLLFISNARAHIITAKNIQGAPDLIVEILSSNRDYDERLKYRTYERAGVAEYWIIDPFDDTVTIFRRAGTRFQRIETTDTLTTPLLPGFALSLRSLFA
ncbi:MAG TPA: Uma2 family endonuclease [Thermoanaerobaculia bacterium]|jgi:Uma2 family endonuclease